MIQYTYIALIGALVFSVECVGAGATEFRSSRWFPCARYKRAQERKHAAVVAAKSWHEALVLYIDQKYLISELVRAAKACAKNPHIAWAILRSEDKQEVYGRYCSGTRLETIPEGEDEYLDLDYESYFFQRCDAQYHKHSAKYTEIAALVLACICYYYPRMVLRLIKELTCVSFIPAVAFMSAYLIFVYSGALQLPRGEQWSLWGLM